MMQTHATHSLICKDQIAIACTPAYFRIHFALLPLSACYCCCCCWYVFFVFLPIIWIHSLAQSVWCSKQSFWFSFVFLLFPYSSAVEFLYLRCLALPCHFFSTPHSWYLFNLDLFSLFDPNASPFVPHSRWKFLQCADTVAPFLNDSFFFHLESSTRFHASNASVSMPAFWNHALTHD